MDSYEYMKNYLRDHHDDLWDSKENKLTLTGAITIILIMSKILGLLEKEN